MYTNMQRLQDKNRVTKFVDAYQRMSVLNGNKKRKAQFITLTKLEKRVWRERLQQKIATLREARSRDLSAVRFKGRTAIKFQRYSRSESALAEFCEDVELQAGVPGIMTAAAAIATAATTSYAMLRAHSVLDKVSNAVEKVSQEATAVKGAISMASTKAGEAFAGANDLFTQVRQALDTFIDRVKEYGELIWKPVLAAFVLWLLHHYAHVPILVGALVSVTCAYLPELKTFMAKYLPRGFHIQAGSSIVSDLIAMTLTCWIPGKDVSYVAGEFMKRVTNVARASEGIESFIGKALNIIEELVNFVLVRRSENRLSFTGKKNAYYQWKREVIDKLEYMAKEAKPPIEEIRKVKDLQIRGFGFHQVLVTAESKRDLAFWMEKLSLAVAPHEGAIAAENNMRAMPLFIMIGGPSGAGKTTLVRMIGSLILMLSGECSAANALENLWQKGTTEYWNGYIGQKCMVMDDCFQVKGKPGDPDSEAMQVIRGIGNWSMPLNFADLANKGKIYMDSPLFIGTTNCMNVEAEWAPFITEPKALVRRFQEAFWIELEDDYRNDEGKFNYELVATQVSDAVQRLLSEESRGVELTSERIMDALPWHIWKLYPHRFDRENITHVPVPGGLREVVSRAAQEIVKRKKGNRKDVKDLRSLLEILERAMAREASSKSEPVVTPVEVQSGASSSGPTLEETLQQMEDVMSERIKYNTKPWSEVRAEYRKQMEELVMKPIPKEDPREGFSTEEMLDTMFAGEKEYEDMFDFLADKYTAWVAWCAHQHPIVSTIVNAAMAYSSVVIMKTVFRMVVSFVKGIVSAVSSALSALLEMIGIKGKSVEASLQSNVKDGSLSVKGAGKYLDVPSFNYVGKVDVQVGVPPNDAVHDHIYHNTVKCYTDEYAIGQFLGLGADVYVYPKHFDTTISKLSPDTKLYFRSTKSGASATMSAASFLKCTRIAMEEYDIAAVSFGAVFLKANRHIVKYFLTQHEVKNILRGSNTAVRLDVANMQQDKLHRVVHVSPTCAPTGPASCARTGNILRGLVKYFAPTVMGDCGAPLSLAESRHYGGRCLFGIHSAGRDNTHVREGFSTIVTQEVARELFQQLCSYKDKGAEEVHEKFPLPTGSALVEMQTTLRDAGVVDGSFELIGKLDKPVHMPTKTALKPSALQKDEIFGPSPSAPAILRSVERDGVVVHPMSIALKAYQSPLECKIIPEMDAITDLAMQKHWHETRHHSRNVLSFEEALVPPAGWKLKPINRKTSAGYKYSDFVSSQFPGKTAFLGFEGDIDFNNPNLLVVKSDVERIVEEAKQGNRLLHLCTDFLKDELRPNHKVEMVATRAISGTPFDYTIATRMYFGAFMAAMFDTNVSNGMAPGINHYTEWYKIPEFLEFDAVFDGDFSRFDASEMPWVHNVILRYINRWYKHANSEWKLEDDMVRYILWLDLVHSRHVTGMGNALVYVVQWNKALPSGHPLTTVVNSMYSLIALTGCYVHLTGDMTTMWQNARFVTFGDDNINSVSDEVKEVFNQVTVANAMKDLFGLSYTAGDKTGELRPYTTIFGATFLKRSFTHDDDECSVIFNVPNVGWVAPLARDSFLFEPYWYKNTRDPASDLSVRVEHCLCEMALHTQEVWDTYAPALLEWCTRNEVAVNFNSRTAARQFVKTRFDIWF